MLQFSLGVLAGTLWLQQFADLPGIGWLVGCVVLGAVLVGCRSRVRGILPIGLAGVALGFAWAGFYAHCSVPPEIPSMHGKTNYDAVGVIQRVPQRKGASIRVRFAVESLHGKAGVEQGNWLVRVSWRDAPDLAVGQRWRLPLRIRPVQSYRNPGSWDYAGWLYRQGMRYTAYVRAGEPQLLGQTPCCRLERLREWLLARLENHLGDDVGSGMLKALTLGDRSGLSNANRKVFSATGTSHLFAISGLHIGLAAAAFGVLVSLTWRHLPRFCARYPARVAAGLAGLTLAVLYALVSGFGVPAQRALVMLAGAVVLLVARDRVTPSRLLAVALLSVLAFDPMAPLDAGFWLSFSAVAAIFALLPHLRGRHWLAQALVLQTGIAVALYPVMLAFGMQNSVSGPLVNLVLVPVFGAVLVPLSLLAVILVVVAPGAGEILGLLAAVFEWVHRGLELLAILAPAVQSPAWHTGRWLLIVLSVLALLAPPGIPGKMPGFALLLLAHLPAPPRLAEGDFRITVLDVGQGQSVVIKTREHLLVYDTGAAFPSGFNLADAVLLPYLAWQEGAAVDALVLSHGDNDHAGAARQLLQGAVVGEIWNGEPGRVGIPGRQCQKGDAWQWDGVSFSFLHPSGESRWRGNNASCVLLVSGPGGSALVPGDIDASVENRLAPRIPRVDIVVAAHHGSASSSVAAWVSATSPGHVVYTAGALNRYGFPKPAVQRRWAKAGSLAWRTDRDGAIRFDVSATSGVSGPLLHHWDTRRYWHLAKRPAGTRPPRVQNGSRDPSPALAAPLSRKKPPLPGKSG